MQTPWDADPLFYLATHLRSWMPPIGRALALTPARPHLTQYKLPPELWTVVGICQLENCTLSVLRLPPSSSLSEGHHFSPPGLLQHALHCVKGWDAWCNALSYSMSSCSSTRFCRELILFATILPFLQKFIKTGHCKQCIYISQNPWDEDTSLIRTLITEVYAFM